MKFVDLTMPISNAMPVLPDDPVPEITRYASIEKEGWNLHRLGLYTHLGTHIDAPWHLLADGKKLSDYPIAKFIGRAVLKNVTGQAEIDADIKNVCPGDILILRTDLTKDISSPDFFETNPVVSRKLAEKIAVAEVNILGIDSYTVDHYPFEIHKYLLRRDILVLENLVNLDRLPETFEIIILPLHVQNMDGAPCRVVARIPD